MIKHLPSFLIVGAAKAGTTTMFQLLKQHPDVYIPEIKECRFFSDIGSKKKNPISGLNNIEATKDYESYCSLFAGKEDMICGDISPDYLFYYSESISNIKKYLSENVKIIISLRDPVERAYSQYMHLRRQGEINMSFLELLEMEDSFSRETTCYGFLTKEAGKYVVAVREYLMEFRNVKIVFFEDFIKDTTIGMKQIKEFIGIKSNVNYQKPQFTNKTGLPSSPMLDHIIDKPWPGKNAMLSAIARIRPDISLSSLKERQLKKPPMDVGAERFLRSYYQEDVRLLEELLSTKVPWKNFN